MRRSAILLLLGAAACSGGATIETTSGATTVTSTTAPLLTGTITVPESSTTTTLPPRPELSTPQVVYFLIDSAVGPPRLTPVWRDATSPQGVAGAIETLLAGPAPAERLGVPAISTAIPSATQLLGVGVVNGLATIDLSSDFFEDPPPERLAQVVYTATRFDEVDSVTFRAQGEPFAGLPGATARLAFRDLQAPVFVEEPVYGGPAAQPGRLRGQARVVAAEFQARVTDTDGLTVADFDVQIDGAGWVDFDVPLPYSVDVDQGGTMTITTGDGVVDIPIPVQLLLPAPGSCSAAGLSSEVEPQGLPAAVEATRKAIVAAAVACDLRALADLGAPGFTYSFADGGDAASFWEREENVGIPVTRLMVQLLATPPVLDTDFPVATYLWPSAFRAAPTAEDFDLLDGIIPAADLDLYRQFNEYLDLRIGIAEDGSWDFAVAGD